MRFYPYFPAADDNPVLGTLKGIKYEENSDVRDSRGRTALFYAARKGMFGIMSFLLNHGADINARDDTDNSLFRSTLSRLTPLPGAGNAVAAAEVAVGAAARITTLARRVSSASEKHLGSPRNQVSRMAFFHFVLCVELVHFV